MENLNSRWRVSEASSSRPRGDDAGGVSSLSLLGGDDLLLDQPTDLGRRPPLGGGLVKVDKLHYQVECGALLGRRQSQFLRCEAGTGKLDGPGRLGSGLRRLLVQVSALELGGGELGGDEGVILVGIPPAEAPGQVLQIQPGSFRRSYLLCWPV